MDAAKSDYGSISLYHCCTPDGIHGVDGIITNEPMFVDGAAGNFRLQSNSPCINAGTNQEWMIDATDLDGHPRLYAGGRVDMGAYEFQGSLSAIPTNWLAAHNLLIDGSDDHGDGDQDGMDNWQEWRCGTDPADPGSRLKVMGGDSRLESFGFVVRWSSVTGKTYEISQSTNLMSLPSFTSLASNIVGMAGSTTYTDETAVGDGPYLYRVHVE